MASSTDAAAVPIRFAVLGPMRVWRGNDEVVDGPPQQRAILALLLVKAGAPVSMAELIDLLWTADPPASAANVVHRCIGTLRRALEPDLPTRAAGRWLIRLVGSYRLNVDVDSLDLLKFRGLADRARALSAQGDQAGAVGVFVEALALWRGPCVLGIEVSLRARQVFAQIDRERVIVAQEAADCALPAGMSRTVLSVLREVAALDPLDEPLQSRLITSLAAAGYQAEALSAYRRVADALATELRINPGRELREAHQLVLRQRTGPASAETPPETPPETPAQNPAGQETQGPVVSKPAPAPLVLPAQLPPDLAMFTGRRSNLTRLDTLLGPADAARSTMAICAIDGIAGIGKTSLAVHWAHQLADRYPDGQLYVDLRGFDPSGAVLGPGKALRGFLDALGIVPQRVPESLEAQAGLYRSLLSGRRVLILLDNARDVAQVRPLLPASSGCLVVITSRNQLAGLITTHAAHTLTLDPFSADEAREALTRRLGPERLAAETAARDEIVEWCAGLPLAMAIVAARATVHQTMPIAAIADELRDTRTRLDAFSGTDDVVADLRAVFSWSYQLLSESAARLFRLLSASAGPDISRNAAASLLGVRAREIRPLLAELTGARLLTEHYPGRYVAHDLIRVYAAELSAELDTDDERRQALGRLLDHYLHTAHHGQTLLWPNFLPAAPARARPGVCPEELGGPAEVLTWFTEERHVLVAAVKLAAGNGFSTHSWELALRLQQFFQRQGYWHDWAATMRTALEAAREHGDTAGEAYSHRSLAGAYHGLGHYDKAIEHLTRTCALFHELGFPRTEHAYVCANFGTVRRELGQFDRAIEHYRDALALFREMGHVKGQAAALEGIGWCQTRLGNYSEAIGFITEGMDLYRDSGDPHGEANCWSSLSAAHHRSGGEAEAVECVTKAIVSFRELGNRADEAECLVSLGDAQLALDDRAGAREAWLRALVMLEELRLPLAEAVRVRLSSVQR
jgi:DNA-binding SARP family transcriptional activator/tetratricopeptide (TPR) repeat protein